MSDWYCYVVNETITKPPEKTVWVQGREVLSNPFKRPNAIGSVRLPASATDDFLSSYGVYAVVVTADPKPGEYYVKVEGAPTVSGWRVTRHDTWRAMTTEEATAYDTSQELAAFLQQVTDALDRLKLIENNVVGSTAAQTQEAVRDIAKYLRHTIRKVLERVL